MLSFFLLLMEHLFVSTNAIKLKTFKRRRRRYNLCVNLILILTYPLNRFKDFLCAAILVLLHYYFGVVLF